MKRLCDCHVHSENSFDGEGSVSEICLSAINKGIDTIAVTDHMEAPELGLGDNSQYGNMKNQLKRSVSHIEGCRDEFKGRLKILKGMELGEPMHNPKLTSEALSIAPFDFILASVHNLKDEEDFYFLEYRENNIHSLLSRYFNELLSTAQNADFDSLAHFTYPIRYIVERTQLKPDLEEHRELIDEILSTLVKRRKALEINTSGLFKKIGVTLPDVDIIKRFRQLGGEYVTLGSDAHNCRDLGQGIDRGMEIARFCGFEHYTVFEKRCPKMVEI